LQIGPGGHGRQLSACRLHSIGLLDEEHAVRMVIAADRLNAFVRARSLLGVAVRRQPGVEHAEDNDQEPGHMRAGRAGSHAAMIDSLLHPSNRTALVLPRSEGRVERRPGPGQSLKRIASAVAPVLQSCATPVASTAGRAAYGLRPRCMQTADPTVPPHPAPVRTRFGQTLEVVAACAVGSSRSRRGRSVGTARRMHG
jgi:hypothetical protein